jgi:VWFA-related protein
MTRQWTILRPLKASALAALLLVIPGSGPAGASGEAGDRPVKAGTTEEVNVRLLELPIVAVDRDGEPVRDLTAEDLEVEIAGDEQEVGFAELVYEETKPQGELPFVRLSLEAPGATEPVAETREQRSRYSIVLVDVENDAKLRRPEAVKQAQDYFKDHMRPGDYVAVLAFDGEIHLETPFTDSPEAVGAAIARGYSRASRPRIEMRRRMENLIMELEECSSGPQRGGPGHDLDQICVRDVANRYAQQMNPRTRDFFEALEGVIRYASGLEENVAVFAVTHGSSAEPSRELIEAARAAYGNNENVAQMQLMLSVGEGVRTELRRLQMLALREEVALYFVDRSSAPAGQISARQRSFQFTGGRPYQAAYAEPQRTMGEIARATGGDLFKDRNLYTGLEAARNTELGRYTVGVYLDKPLKRGDLERVRVRTDRRGVEIRNGYGIFKKTAEEEVLSGQMTFGKTESLEDRPGRFIPFVMRIDPRGLGYQQEEKLVATNLTVHFVVETAEGRRVTDAYHFLAHSYPLQVWKSGQEEPIVLRGWLEAEFGEYRLAATIRNPKNGAGGKITRRIRVVPGSAS